MSELVDYGYQDYEKNKDHIKKHKLIEKILDIYDPPAQQHLSPEKIYKMKCEQVEEQHRDSLMQLYNMDLKDFDKNLEALRINPDTDLNEIAYALMDANN